MQVLQKWRYGLILKATITESNRIANRIPNGFASFHSTTAFFGKWKNKYGSDVGDQNPSEDHIRFSVKLKRSKINGALKNILLNDGCSTSGPKKVKADNTDVLNKESQVKSARQVKRAQYKKLKRKLKRDNSSDDYDDKRESVFRTTFGKRGSSWNCKPSETGFDSWENFNWNNINETEMGVESPRVGTYADRKILGLPTSGPLKIEDVKAAFRSSALKWHPDKHQGSSQGDAAEEKFKQCVNAYKSLCNDFSTT